MGYQSTPITQIGVIVAIEPSKCDIVVRNVEQQLQLRLVQQ
jgi:hypothetical protein